MVVDRALDGQVDLILIDLPPRAGGKLITTGLTAADKDRAEAYPGEVLDVEITE